MTPENDDDRDPLARATVALKRAPAPDGPSEEALARTLAALRAAADLPGVTASRRRKIMFMTLKIAAAALMGAVGLYHVAGPTSAEATFVAVARKLHEARTLSYRSSATVPGLPAPMILRNFFKEPGLMRVEAGGEGGAVTILDAGRGRSLILVPPRKTAILLEQTKPKEGEDPAARALGWVRGLVGKTGEAVGRERIDGVEADGFRIREEGRTLVVWADPKALVPLRVDVTARFGGQEVRATLSDFRLDPKLDDALFRLEPPEGYTVQRIKGSSMFDAPETNVARVLRAFADKHAGALPARLDDSKEFESLFPKDDKGKPIDGADPETLDFSLCLGQALTYTRSLKGSGYAGAGVKLGDAGKIVFWYRPEGSEGFKALYADLHVGDVDPAQLPASKP